MGQIELYELLKDLRNTGDHTFKSVPELRVLLKERGAELTGIGADIIKLEMFGYIESVYKDRTGNYNLKNWLRRFRIKKKYIKNNRGV